MPQHVTPLQQNPPAYRLPGTLAARGQVYVTYEKFLRFAPLKCALVAGFGHAAAVAIPMIMHPLFHARSQTARVPPHAGYAFTISAALAILIFLVTRIESRSYYQRVAVTSVACCVAVAAALLFFGFPAVHPSVLSAGIATIIIYTATALVCLYEPLTRIASEGRLASDDQIADYLKLEASSWGTLSVQVFAAAVGVLFGFWYASGAIAEWFIDKPILTMQEFERERLVVSLGIGAQAGIYVGLAAWGVVAGAFQQARLARGELLCIASRRLPNGEEPPARGCRGDTSDITAI